MDWFGLAINHIPHGCVKQMDVQRCSWVTAHELLFLIATLMLTAVTSYSSVMLHVRITSGHSL